MEKKRNIIYIVLFFLIISLNGLVILFKEDNKVSDYENRELALRPNITLNFLKSGDFFKKFDDFINDQVYQKEYWQKQYVNINLNILNKYKINDFVVTNDNKILTYNGYDQADKSQLKSEVEVAVKEIKEAEKIVNDNGGKLYFITIPMQSSMFRDYYPEYFNTGQENSVFRRDVVLQASKENKINYINMYNTLSQYEPNKIYHITEHHYNFLGVYYTYKDIINTLKNDKSLKMEKSVTPYKSLNVQNKTFFGAYNRQLAYLVENKDRLLVPQINTEGWEIYNNKKQIPYVVNTSRPRYGAYMDGDISESIIKTNKPQYDNALIIGDSFTNPLEPLIAMNFNETRSLDFRQKDVSVDFKKYIEEYKPKVVLVIVNEGAISPTNQNIKMKQ